MKYSKRLSVKKSKSMKHPAKKTSKRNMKKSAKKGPMRSMKRKLNKNKRTKKKRGGFVRAGSVQHFMTCLGNIVFG